MAKNKRPTEKGTLAKSAVKKKKNAPGNQRAGKATTKTESSSDEAKPSATTDVESDVARQRRSASECAIVGLGASAGGLDAFKRFFTEMPPDCGMAFVLIQHLDPTHESLTGDLLAKYTTMNVEQVEDRMPVEANHVYVIPPNRYLAVRRGELHLTEPIERRGLRMPIDFFFQSLAEDQEERAIGIILSGTGTDGTMGMKAIKAHVGMMMVQEPSTAQYDGMPRSAMATGMADYILPIEKMPQLLIKYVNHPYINHAGEATLAQHALDHLNMILALLRARTSYDFHCYKKTTLSRRIQRRMGLSNVKQPADYVNFLRENPAEVTRLFKDLLIGVTSFFREPEAWQVLETEVLPELVRSRSRQTLDARRTEPNPGEFGDARGDGSPVRVWIPGCATGEEAYSMAILLSEQLEAAGGAGMQIFATDINDDALEVARTGVYPDSIAADVSPRRLQKFFIKSGSTYRVNKSLRESVTFAVQNLISDPPFSKLDLICCRNLLIYLESQVHKKVLSLFHFALNDGGYLFLGNSETIGTQHDLFNIVSKKWRIYRRIGSSRPVDFPIVPGHERPRDAAVEAQLDRPVKLGQLAQDMLLGEYAPPSVLITTRCEILHYFGATAQFLEHPTGEASHDLTVMAREGLRTKLRAAIQRASQRHETVKVTDARVKRDRTYHAVSIIVKPLETTYSADHLLLVSFLEPAEPQEARLLKDDAPTPEAIDAEASHDLVFHQLKQQLNSTRDDLQTTIEELETSSEELKASNEEAMSMNEELQSTNEELYTSKEELQSLNEELSTVNNQLQDKIDELEVTYNDLNNLLSSTEIATLFLDTDMCIKRFTPVTTQLLKLIPSDVGRPISDISMNFDDPDLLTDAQTVLDKLTPVEKEVKSDEGRWYIRRILPYRTHDNKIDGLVVTLDDVTKLEQAQKALRESEEQFRVQAVELDGLFAKAPAGLCLLDAQQRYLRINEQLAAINGLPVEEHFGRPVADIFPNIADQVVPLIQQVIDTAQPSETVEISGVLDNQPGVKRHFLAAWFPVLVDEKVEVVGGIVQEITELKRAEAERAVLDVATAERQRIGADLHDTTSQELTGLGFMAQSLLENLSDESHAEAATARKIEEGLQRVLNQVRRFSQGLVPVGLDTEGLMAALQELATHTYQTHNIDCAFDCTQPVSMEDNATATAIYLIAQEAVTNAVKHAQAKRIHIELSRDADRVSLRVRDDGVGIGQPSEKQGVGLRIMRHRAGLINAALDIEPVAEGGTLVTCVLTT